MKYLWRVFDIMHVVLHELELMILKGSFDFDGYVFL